MESQGVNPIYLSKTVLSLLNNPPVHLIVRFQGISSKRMSLLVTDTGATDHILTDKSAFISYYPVSGRCSLQLQSNQMMILLIFPPLFPTGQIVLLLHNIHH